MAKNTDGWKANVFVEIAAAALMPKLIKAQVVVQGNIRRRLNISNNKGANPSAEGESPHKGTGRLQKSIVIGPIRKEGHLLIAPVGSNDLLGKVRRLEFGFKGTDSAGRNINQGPRPYLRPGLTESYPAIKKILGLKTK
jgi:hypothetical protein